MTQRFQVVEEGKTYRLSDGTVLNFLAREGEAVGGLSVEEIFGVLVHRLESLRRKQPAAGRYLSLTITDLESADNWMRRWDDSRTK